MNKRKIEKIKFTKEQQEEIDKIKKGEPVKKIRIVTNKRGFQYEVKSYKSLTRETARRKLFRFYGGLCIICATSWPDYKVTYDCSDKSQRASRIERYCNSCAKKKELI
jgi:hypothetical protein